MLMCADIAQRRNLTAVANEANCLPTGAYSLEDRALSQLAKDRDSLEFRRHCRVL